jgi:hypothetical protein
VFSLSRRQSSLGFHTAVLAAMVCSAAIPARAQAPPLARVRYNNPCAHPAATATDAPPISRVRSTDTFIAALISRAAKGSETFQRLLATIQRSNGIVYIEPGNCGHGARACLKLSVVANGPDRFLRVLVDRQKTDSDVDFMGAIRAPARA